MPIFDTHMQVGRTLDAPFNEIAITHLTQLADESSRQRNALGGYQPGDGIESDDLACMYRPSSQYRLEVLSRHDRLYRLMDVCHG